MKGDFSRSTYRPANHYTSVRLQQGRVLLDAEWNEQADVTEHVERTTTTDVVGPCGAPKHPTGTFANFLVQLDADGKDLRVGPGRIYVDGILCENDDPDGVAYTAQPDLPGAVLPESDGAYAVYLDVWERHLTVVDQFGQAFPPLLEVALAGPDTATRTRLVWQVKLQPVDSATCDAFGAPTAPTGHLRADELPSVDPVDDCLVPTGGGYRRLENQLYRVEVHDASQPSPFVKWSRDNGSMVSRVTAIDTAALTIVVEDEGRDDVLGFGAAKWVELSDEERTLGGLSGALFEVDTVTGTSVVVKNPDGLSFAVGTNATLRRWDGTSTLSADTPVELEDGVRIEIDGGTFTVGDHWLIPARTSTGKVEWPRDEALPPAPIFESRHGTLHHHCPLAVAVFAGGAFTGVTDCRPQFPPLTAITASDVSYDPSKCSNLTGTSTVQEAIDVLCKATPQEDQKGIRVEKVTLLDGSELENDTLVLPEVFARGIRISCGERLFQDSVRNRNGDPNPVCFVTLELPWPITEPDRGQWQAAQFGILGFTPLKLAAEVNADNNEIFWIPSTQPPSEVVPWLADVLNKVVLQATHGQINRIQARLTLKGNYIWGPDAEPELYLDGDAFGQPGDGQVRTRLPSGNGRRGGDFEMWFWIGRQ